MQPENDNTEELLVKNTEYGTEKQVSVIPPSNNTVNQPTLDHQSAASPEMITENKKWTKHIPSTNLSFMIISLLLVFGLDLIILIGTPDLVGFFVIMLVVLALFVVFFCLENFIFKKRFAYSDSSLDNWIIGLIRIRNLIFVLNFIPFIQLIGMLAISVLGIPLLVVYIILIKKRLNSIHFN